MSKQDEYYQMAIDWCNNYMENNEPLINFKAFDGITIFNTHKTLKVWLDRLQNIEGSEKMASFVKIKKYKDFINRQHGN